MHQHKAHQFPGVNDQWILIFIYPVLAILVVHIGNDNSFFTLLTIPSYYTDLLLAFACTYLVGFFYRSFFRKTEAKFNWTDQLKKRIGYQLLYGILIPVLILASIEALYLEFLLDIPVLESSMLYLELPVITTFCILINLLYTLLYFRKHTLQLTQELTQKDRASAPVPVFKTFFVVNKSTRSLHIPASEAAYFRVIEKSTYLVTAQEKYLYDSSLEQLIKEIDPSVFFQLNRQIIASRMSIEGYSHTDTRKLSISLNPAISEEVFVSKTRATAFLHWLKHK